MTAPVAKRESGPTGAKLSRAVHANGLDESRKIVAKQRCGSPIRGAGLV